MVFGKADYSVTWSAHGSRILGGYRYVIHYSSTEDRFLNVIASAIINVLFQ